MIFPPLEYLGNAYDNNSGCTNLFDLEQHDTNKPACFYSHVFIGEVECDNASAFAHCTNWLVKLTSVRQAGGRQRQRGKYHCTVDLRFDRFGISCMTTDNFCFYLQNRLIQASQTGGQRYSDTSPFSIPCFDFQAAEKRSSLLRQKSFILFVAAAI